ncbi:archaellin/type IV pilin N-terminal domain-containing protein [Nitrososphaera sp.]|uniref:archaellin/type IV pilin N-terminal domain-containing protein n=1 Tax=Nitrososphaera sp. TaxID=1971748 RepID=UPI00307F66C4
MRKLRAISPAIATIALIGIAVVASAAVGSYAMNQSSTLKQDLSADLTEVHLVQLRKGTCEWNWGLSLKNTGTLPITYIDGRIRQNNGNDWWIGGWTPDGAAAPGEMRRVSADGCADITAGRSYQAWIQIYYHGPQLQSKLYTRTIVAEGL